MALKPVSLDEQMKSAYLDRYEPTKGVDDYVFICSKNKYPVTLHYSPELKKTFHCFGGSCCKLVEKKVDYTVYLIAQYTDYNNPKAPLELKYLRASKTLDDQITRIAKRYSVAEKITQQDLILTLDASKGKQFKTIAVQLAPEQGRVATKEQLLALKEEIKQALPKLEESIAQVMTEEQLQQAFAELGEDLDDEPEEVEEPKKTTKKAVKKAPAKKVEEPEDDEDDEDIDSDELEEVPPTAQVSKKSKKSEPVNTVEEESEGELDGDDDFDLDSLL